MTRSKGSTCSSYRSTTATVDSQVIHVCLTESRELIFRICRMPQTPHIFGGLGFSA